MQHPNMTDHLPQDISPLNAPIFCDQCDEPDASSRLELTIGRHVNICDACAKDWEKSGAIFE